MASLIDWVRSFFHGPPSTGIAESESEAVEPGRPRRNSVALQPTPAETAAEAGRLRFQHEFIRAELTASSHVRPDTLETLMAMIDARHEAFGRIKRDESGLDADTLTVAEKRALGLNTRMKYRRDFIACFEPASLATIEPKAYISDLQLNAFHRAARRDGLSGLRKLGIDEVELRCVGDGRDCAAARRRVYRIDEAPELPLAGCDARYCRCTYIPRV